MPSASRMQAKKSRPRMGGLAKLPVFFNLENKRAVLAGGTVAAAWKAELLAASGANVEIYAAELEAEMQTLVEQGAAAGTLIHHSRPWAIDIFSGAAIALADAETECEAQAFYCAAVAAGVPVNVIDKPAYCQFQFGSIVNRSPVVTSISTDGAAPILGQAVRRRIETLLPPALADWGQLAKDVRDEVTSRLSPGAQRRAFWEHFSDQAFGKAPDAVDRQSATALIDKIANSAATTAGKVTLVVIGTSDPELLTMKAVRALQSADVILFDGSVSDEILELARREAKRMPFGDPSGEQRSQTDIRDLMIKLTNEGKHILSVHSGDVSNIDDLRKEASELVKNGVAITLIPCVSSSSVDMCDLENSLTNTET